MIAGAAAPNTAGNTAGRAPPVLRQPDWVGVGIGGQRAADEDAAGGEAAVLRTEGQVVAGVEILVRVIAADQPVELAVEQPARRAQLLAERLELAAAGVRDRGCDTAGRHSHSRCPTPDSYNIRDRR